ncbi:MAG: rhomboid family intramembrane serine protease [Spirochaetia bacterium]|nr:rhomboid family intramembrane serine protease [Spirochaetia bacterium]
MPIRQVASQRIEGIRNLRAGDQAWSLLIGCMNFSVTKGLIVANVAAFVLASPYSPYAQEIFGTLGLVPGEFHVWQPLTSLFLHGGLIHLGFNMLALWSLGPPLERDLGSVRYTLLYFISGLAGALAVMILSSASFVPTVGASGAIVGLMGALAIFYPRASIAIFFVPMQARTAAFVFGGITLLLTFVDQGSGISHAGHLGGLIGGFLYSKFLSTQPPAASRRVPPYSRNQDPWTRRTYPGEHKVQSAPPEVKLVYDPATGRYYLEKRSD